MVPRAPPGLPLPPLREEPAEGPMAESKLVPSWLEPGGLPATTPPPPFCIMLILFCFSGLVGGGCSSCWLL